MTTHKNLVLLLGFSWMLMGCNAFFYYPSQKIYYTPHDFGAAYEDIYFTSKDGTQLNGWFIPAIGSTKGTVIYFHGNAENITNHYLFVQWLPEEGFNLFIFDYRGYGASSGKPDRQGIVEDSMAAINYIRQRSDVDPHRILIFGQSLGGALALAAVAQDSQDSKVGIRAVVVESTFASYRNVAREKLGDFWLTWPFQWPLAWLLISDDQSPLPMLKKIAPIPLLVIHGDDDQTVSYSQGRQLYQAAFPPKYFWTVAGGHHTEAFTRYAKEYRPRLVKFFEEHLNDPIVPAFTTEPLSK
jgi:fermentation-respiration switch protein FrsA (DUF1100 family)